MKNLFFKIMNNLIFSYAKYVVTLLLSVFISISISANNNTYYAKAVVGIHASSPTGSGCVYVYETNSPSNKSETSCAKETTQSLVQEYESATYTIVAEVSNDYYFCKWVNSDGNDAPSTSVNLGNNKKFNC